MDQTNQNSDEHKRILYLIKVERLKELMKLVQ